MEFTQFIISSDEPEKFDGDLLVYCLAQSKNGYPEFTGDVGNILHKTFELGDFCGKSGEKILIYPGETTDCRGFNARRIAFLGIGNLTSDISSVECREMLRKLGGRIAKTSESVKASSIQVILPILDVVNIVQTAECISEGIALGDYRFGKYKNTDPDQQSFAGIRKVVITTEKSKQSARRGMRLGEVAGKAACLARDMANEPANEWTPNAFAVIGKDVAKKYAMKCRVLEKNDMRRLGFGGILAVNQGSTEPPKLVILEYNGKKDRQTLLLVGKGITFDSGGISLKPPLGMEDMKYDMCGGAAVLALMQAVGEERPDLNVIAMIPATDNMLGGSAVKPGDVIRHYGGITSEIVNTDAEGRMVLADSLAYGIKKYKPDCVIDIATLTGAAIIGLGHHYTGLLSNNDQIVKRLMDVGMRTGEPLWRLPLGKEYSKQIDSKVADIKNAGGKAAGTITAAAYLEKFVGKTVWAHLDIAGTAWGFTEKSYIPKGPSGIGVRTLLELIRSWKEIRQ